MTRTIIIWIYVLATLTALGGCQNLPEYKSRLNSAQIAALKQEGFVKSEEGWEFSASEKLLFGSNEDTLLPNARGAVERIARLLINLDISNVRIDGHADITGSVTYNDQLSLHRAQAVRDVLVQTGMSTNEIRVRGLGNRSPIVSNKTPDGRAQNRRVVIVIASE